MPMQAVGFPQTQTGNRHTSCEAIRDQRARQKSRKPVHWGLIRVAGEAAFLWAAGG